MASPTWWHEFGWIPGAGDGQRGLACCNSWGHKETDTTEWLNWNELDWKMPQLLFNIVREEACVCVCSIMSSFATPWTVAHQAPLSRAFSRIHWSGLPFPPLGDLPDPGIEPTSPALVGGFFTTKQPGKPKICCCLVAQSCPTLSWPHGLKPARLLCPWDFLGKNIGEGCHFLFKKKRKDKNLIKILVSVTHVNA